VPGRLQRWQQPLPEPAGATGDQYVHPGSLARQGSGAQHSAPGRMDVMDERHDPGGDA
jgi:hypothetical protein